MSRADPIQAAFEAVPRPGFLPEDQREHAAQDRALPIGHGQTNSQPSTVRQLLALLEVETGNRVLDVGAGSGWTTALLGQLVGSEGVVYGVELEPELVEFGGRNIAQLSMPWISIRPALPDVLGLPEAAPFDRILVSAEARELPQQLVDQLGDSSRMVIPVNGRLVVAERGPAGEVEAREVGCYAFVPLR